MRTRTLFFLLFGILTITVLLTGCFSPWAGDKGTITISLGGSGKAHAAGRTLVNPADVSEYSITLRGPGGTITRTLNGSGSITLEPVPGTWDIDIRGYQVYYDGSKILTLRAIGMKTVEVKRGASARVPVTMITATEAANWNDLILAINYADEYGREEIILLTGEGDGYIIATEVAEISSSLALSGAVNHITLMADRDIRIIRDASFTPTTSVFSVLYGSTLTLGKKGMTGTITIDGNKIELSSLPTSNPASQPLISVQDGVLKMYDGITLTNNKNTTTNQTPTAGGAVYVGLSGKFEMYGGTIAGNETSGYGGGVYVSSGSFTMHGGTISDNAAGSEGGGVRISTGNFTMNGGTISANTANNFGGGVSLSGSVVFIKENTGGIIYGENEGKNSNKTVYDGKAVYFNPGGVIYYRNKTLKAGDGLRSDTLPPAHGSGWNDA